MDQRAHAEGRNNVIVQIVGDGNTVVSGYPHLTLTRYLTRRRVSSEIELLSPYAMAVPMVGRKEEQGDLRAWLDGEHPISVRVITGRGGSGKTRLALETCEAICTDGWDAGFVEARELDRFLSQQNLSTWGWQRPTLVVIDYAATYAQRLHDWLAELSDHAGMEGKPLRVLFLERYADPDEGWWQVAFGRGSWADQAIRRLLDPAHPVPLVPLADANHRHAILSTVLERTASQVRPPRPGTDADFDRHLAQITWGGEPLFLMMAGLRVTQGGIGSVLALNRTDLALELADREIARIEGIAQAHKIHPAFLCHMVAYATLCRGLTRTEAMDVVAAEKEALRLPSAGDPGDVADTLHEVLPAEDGAIAPLLPDMLGEALVLRGLNPHQDEGSATVGRAFEQRGPQVVSSVIRCAQDYGDTAAVPLVWLDSWVSKGEIDVDVLMAIAAELPESSLVLAPYAARLQSSIVGQLRQRTTTGDKDSLRPLLAGSLHNLAIRLSDLGQREPALDAAKEAVELYRELAAARPDAFRPDLAMSLHNLANRLSDLGQREPALDAAKEAVELRRELAAARPDAFRPNLAGSLHNLANCLGALGQREAALDTAKEAVSVLATDFLRYPEALTGRMTSCLQTYLRVTEAVGEEVDLEPIAPILNKLAELGVIDQGD
jgi:tetratricopeptide (TPR) repeat protein